jgi:hypothetical protein
MVGDFMSLLIAAGLLWIRAANHDFLSPFSASTLFISLPICGYAFCVIICFSCFCINKKNGLISAFKGLPQPVD